MQIQINSDHHITGSPELAGHVQALVRDTLDRFSDRITRVEVHLNDLNSVKGGADKRCLMEARLAGLGAVFNGAPVPLSKLVALKFASIPYNLIVDARITAVRAGISVDADQIASRDRMLEKNPDLIFVGAHLGSLEWDVNELGKTLDRFPNMAVDMAARMGQLFYQTHFDREKCVRSLSNIRTDCYMRLTWVRMAVKTEHR